MAREDKPKELEKGKSLYLQSEDLDENDFPQLLLDNGYMLTHASPTDHIEVLITKEECQEHSYHYVTALTQKTFFPGHLQTPGTMVFVFNSWQDLTRAMPFDISRFRKLELQLVIDAADKQRVQESLDQSSFHRRHAKGIVTPDEWRRMKDRSKFRNN